jgi:pyruvate,water dikinase
MRILLPLDEITEQDDRLVGGKASNLARIARSGVDVPRAVCVSTTAYEAFVEANGLRDMVRMELARRPLEDMRWEELWDAGLRIRAAFLAADLPAELADSLESAFQSEFDDVAVVVRSSAPGEDSGDASFAGLHESFVNVVGVAEILSRIPKVWASLWSDRALMYRRELGLDVDHSSMAVVVQEMVVGDRSGVAFCVHPTDPELAAVEAVYGLNQGLVDGSIEPDRWQLDRRTGRVVEHVAASDRRSMVPRAGGAGLELVIPERAGSPPLDKDDLARVWSLSSRAEELFGGPQDVEWTLAGTRLVMLQTRPVTAVSDPEAGDQRSWYLSLHRSFENLKELRRVVEEERLPALDAAAVALAAIPLEETPDDALASEIERRRRIHSHWVDVYWREFIPLAHGIRLFGQVYNDVVRPQDPFEFMELLAATPLLSLQRNTRLDELADIIRRDPKLAVALAAADGERIDAAFEQELAGFLRDFGDSAYGAAQVFADRQRLIRLLLELAARPSGSRTANSDRREELAATFLGLVEPDRRRWAEELLQLGRACYRLRDDDNLYLGALAAQVVAATEEGRQRVAARQGVAELAVGTEEVLSSLRDPNRIMEAPVVEEPLTMEPGIEMRPRQLVGQPAATGVAIGPARVVRSPEDLFDVHDGEVLVCDAIDPNMTFVIPLVSAIVERRGGMLIHGAIIAREYGLPCVTGIARATTLISTGDPLTVDGYLGIVTVG